MLEQTALRALHRLDPELAHDLSLRAIRTPFVALPGASTSDRLATELAGLKLANPVGLAAGYDKNAVSLAPLMKAGFGFLEVGAATPLPQPGNAKPRLFRLNEDRAVINRFGFNNDGAETIAKRLKNRPRGIPVGLNLGANKTSTDRAADYANVLAVCGPFVDFATVNVSSPNTERLRDLQGKAALTELLEGVAQANNALAEPRPIFLKIAPDLTDTDLEEIAEIAASPLVDAVIATNTTVGRRNLKSVHADETGGLSGAPLFALSTRILARLSQLTGGEVPLIGVGGVGSAEEAYTKIRAGASVVQLYSAMVYEGLSLIPRICSGLDEMLLRDGFASVAEAVGTDRERWL